MPIFAEDCKKRRAFGGKTGAEPRAREHTKKILNIDEIIAKKYLTKEHGYIIIYKRVRVKDLCADGGL